MPPRPWMTSLAKAAAVLVLLTLSAPARAQTSCGAWSPETMPGAIGKRLIAVSASSATDVWAVGNAVYHWDGSRWSSTPAPGLGDPDTVLSAVAAVAPGNAWAVGFVSFFGTPQTLVEHWNGSRWNVVPSPTITGGSSFAAVAAVNANDAWAVGLRAGGLPEFQATSVTLTSHWNGSSWSAVPSPNVSNRSHRLTDVAAIASNDVWAVGYSRDLTELYRTLILHWNGSSWTVTPSPNLPGENFLDGVSALSANDVWAVGEAWDGVTSRQIFLHWDGSSWSQVDGPGGPVACVGCTGDVVAMGPADVWAVGSTIGHWDGTQWTLAPNPQVPGAIGIAVQAVAKVGTGKAWSVGSSFDPEGVESALSLHLTPGGGTTNLAPVAMASAAPSSGPGPLEVHFSSAGSADPDGSIVSYLWNFGDSTYPLEQSDPNPIHTYLQTGPLTYHATLHVRDNHGAVTETSVEVLITPPVHVEDQDVVEVNAGAASASFGRDVIHIADHEALPVAGALVTAHYRGPLEGMVNGVTGSDGRVVLETLPALDAASPWCFEVTAVAKSGFLYAPASNVVTEQCEGSPSVSVGASAPRLAFALRVSPNPSRGESVLTLTLPTTQAVRVTILDLGGRQVRELISATLSAGEHRIRWDGLDRAGRAAQAGVFFGTASAGSRSVRVRMVRMR